MIQNVSRRSAGWQDMAPPEAKQSSPPGSLGVSGPGTRRRGDTGAPRRPHPCIRGDGAGKQAPLGCPRVAASGADAYAAQGAPRHTAAPFASHRVRRDFVFFKGSAGHEWRRLFPAAADSSAVRSDIAAATVDLEAARKLPSRRVLDAPQAQAQVGERRVAPRRGARDSPRPHARRHQGHCPRGAGGEGVGSTGGGTLGIGGIASTSRPSVSGSQKESAHHALE